MSLGHITVWCPQYTLTGVIPHVPRTHYCMMSMYDYCPTWSTHLSDYWSDYHVPHVPRSDMSGHLTVWCPHTHLLEWFPHVTYCIMTLVHLSDYWSDSLMSLGHITYYVPSTHWSDYWSDSIMSLGHIRTHYHCMLSPVHTYPITEWFPHVPRTHYCTSMMSIGHTYPITGVIASCP